MSYVQATDPYGKKTIFRLSDSARFGVCCFSNNPVHVDWSTRSTSGALEIGRSMHGRCSASRRCPTAGKKFKAHSLLTDRWSLHLVTTIRRCHQQSTPVLPLEKLSFHEHQHGTCRRKQRDFRSFFVCLFVSYLFRVGHSTDMCSLLQENLLGKKRVYRGHNLCTCMLKKILKMKHFNMEITQDQGVWRTRKVLEILWFEKVHGRCLFKASL